MKKIISVVLCAIMILACVPFTAFAEGGTGNQLTGDYSQSFTFVPGITEYFVPAGGKYTIPSGETFYIHDGYTVTVEEGAKLVVNGAVEVMTGGSLFIKGALQGANNVVTHDKNAVKVFFSFENPADKGFENMLKVKYAISEDPSFMFSTANAGDVKYVNFDSPVVDVPLNQYLFVDVEFDGANTPDYETGKYDTRLVPVYVNDQAISAESSTRVIKATTGAEITYAHLRKMDDYLYTYKILLPSGEGYEVEGRNCEIGADGTVYLNYGQSFAFRVNIDEDYDMSPYQVYIYNGYGWLNVESKVVPVTNPDGTPVMNEDGTPKTETVFSGFEAKRDADGYYTIAKITGDTTVSVVGVVKNETINMIGSIIEAITNVFNMIKEFFAGLIEQFGGLFG